MPASQTGTQSGPVQYPIQSMGPELAFSISVPVVWDGINVMTLYIYIYISECTLLHLIGGGIILSVPEIKRLCQRKEQTTPKPQG